MKKLFFLVCFFFCFSVSASNKFSVKLDKCIDGDTARFFINGESRTVRFLSINAPEIAHDDVEEEFYGEESSQYVCKVLKNASSIKLQYDPKSDEVDKYDRVLAWVFVDGELLQHDLVSNGYAQVKYVYDDYLYSNELKELESIAKEKKLGMWSDDVSSNDDFFDLLNDFLSSHDSFWVYVGCAFVIALIIKFLFKLK